jgi:hypothetical protein
VVDPVVVVADLKTFPSFSVAFARDAFVVVAEVDSWNLDLTWLLDVAVALPLVVEASTKSGVDSDSQVEDLDSVGGKNS